ncbi:hypothetical protein [Stenotrophomonas sp.]|uniref:hypothetical protein n=1 Tax=Stenotrophomonas sp. TaxID=69392 RepID=UPI00289C1672|nr:hypothetical protein [Stenotrophomonas sp.]
MRNESGSIVVLLLGIATGLIVLWVMLFDRYTYYDYRPAECGVGGIGLHVRLTGEFSSRQPALRASPYRLSIEASDLSPGDRLEDIALTPRGAPADPVVPSIYPYELDSTHAPGGTLQLVTRPLPLEYSDYTLVGKLRREISDVRPVRLSCLIERHYHSEWRSPWFDALMSV